MERQENNVDFGEQLDHIRAFYARGQTRPVAFRREQLRKLHRALCTHEETLLEALRRDLGKSALEGFLAELGFVVSEIDHTLRHLNRWARPKKQRAPWLAWPSRGYQYPDPYGVALIIGPWNYPLQLQLSPLVGALAAGNCAVLKPSELAPHTSAAITRLIQDTFPPEYVLSIEGGREVSEALLKEHFDYIFFTGSTPVGRVIMEAAARHLTPVTLELGGKSPVIVCEDTDVQTAARRILWGKALNAGQTCVAPDHVYVHQSIYDEFVQALDGCITDFFGEDPQQSDEYGRIINERHFMRLSAYLNDGHIAAGGWLDKNDLYFAPTILTEVDPDAPVMQEEIFGPILPVLPFSALETLLESLQQQPKPLALYLFSNDAAIQQKVLTSTGSGGVCINDTMTHMIGKDLPFGGVGASGMGAYHGKASFDTFTHYKSVLQRSLWPDLKLRYPPIPLSLHSIKRIYHRLMRR